MEGANAAESCQINIKYYRKQVKAFDAWWRIFYRFDLELTCYIAVKPQGLIKTCTQPNRQSTLVMFL